MVIIRKYALLLPAQLAQMELGRHGIKSVILDEALGSVAPCFAMDGGIRLSIANEDEDQAEIILQAMKERQTN